MEKKIFGFNMDIELKQRLATAATKKYTNSSNLLNQILSEWLDAYDGVEKVKEINEVRVKELTPQEHLNDWNFRKKMVVEGKFPVHMGEEYPDCNNGGNPSVFLKPAEKEEEKKPRKKPTEEEVEASIQKSRQEEIDANEKVIAALPGN